MFRTVRIGASWIYFLCKNPLGSVLPISRWGFSAQGNPKYISFLKNKKGLFYIYFFKLFSPKAITNRCDNAGL